MIKFDGSKKNQSPSLGRLPNRDKKLNVLHQDPFGAVKHIAGSGMSRESLDGVEVIKEEEDDSDIEMVGGSSHMLDENMEDRIKNKYVNQGMAQGVIEENLEEEQELDDRYFLNFILF
jgi:hypothetical protein